jgi:hypothetical protein
MEKVGIVRRLLALVGPLAAVAALSLPWWLTLEPSSPAQTGWQSFQHVDLVLCALAAPAALAAVLGERSVARGACTLAGAALMLVGAWTLVDSPWQSVPTLTGPVVTLGAGAATALAGFFLYAPRRSASSLTTA